jgi:predicted DNA binding protein
MWFSTFGSRHADAIIEVLSHLDSGNGEMLMDVRIKSYEGGSWAEEIRKCRGVINVGEIGTSGGTAILRVTSESYPIIGLFHKLGLIWRLPFQVKNGDATIVLTGPYPSFLRIMKDSRTRSLNFVVEAIYRSMEGDKPLLTPRQTEIFRRAMAIGYYEVPRQVNLTEFALRMGMAPSSLSEILSVIEKKLLQHVQDSV